MKQLSISIIAICLLIIALLMTYSSEKVALIFETYSPKILQGLYDRSQYTVPNSSSPISDALLYAYAGYEYVNGDNPLRINAEHLTVGKYLIGMMYMLTGYIKASGAVFVILLCFLWLWIIKHTTRSHLALFVFFFLFVTDTNVRYQITGGPLLDIIQIFFWSAYTIVFLYTVKAKKVRFAFSAGIMLGLLASSKMYIPAVLVFLVSLTYIFFASQDKKLLIRTLSTIVLASISTYVLTYLVYFLKYDGNIVDFIKSQLWIFHFWTDNPVNGVAKFGAILPLILFNQYHVWWGDSPIIAYEEWSIMWPIGFIAMIVSLIVYARTRTNPHWEKIRYLTDFIALWLIVVFLYLLTVPISPRYLLLLYVPGYMFVALTIYAARIQKK